jgi:hypothetical protein
MCNIALWGAAMAIYRLFRSLPMGPDEIDRLGSAYELTLKALSLKDRNDPLTEMIAKKIIEVGQTGVKEPEQISALAIKGLGMNELKKEDIDRQGGWLVRVKTPPDLERMFYVYELDWYKARELIEAKVPVDDGETIEAVATANIHALTGLGMKPGQVLQHG